MDIDETFYYSMTNRNLGILNPSEQKKIKKTTISIAGLGGIGGLIAERLLRCGIEKIKIADPGIFKYADLNRQVGSNIHTIGKKKTSVLFKELKNINPNASITCFDSGINTEKEIILFCQNSKFVVNQMDFGFEDISIKLQEECIKNECFYMHSVSFGYAALVSIFSPTGTSLQKYNDHLESVKNSIPSISKIFPFIPPYLKHKNYLFKKVLKGQVPAPATSFICGLAASVIATEIIKIIIGRGPFVFVPDHLYIDMLTRNYKIVNVGKLK